MKWREMLTPLEVQKLDRLDAEIAVLKTIRYKLQNAATKRVQREKDARKKRRSAKQAKGQSERARAGESAAVGGDSS
jgi:hypothetical protein